MRKWLIVPPILFLIIIALSAMTKESYVGIPFGESDLYDKMTLLQSGNYLKDIVVLPEESYNYNDAIEVINRLDHLPSSILAAADKKRIKIILFNGKLTDNPSAAYLKGKIPRGYPNNVTWDDVPGIGGSKFVLVKIGSSEKGMGHGSLNLEYHELAHTLYHFVFNDKKSEFNQIWADEANHLFPHNPYFLNYEEEYFAEGFAYYFYSNDSRAIMEKQAPETFHFFNSLH